MQIQDSRMSWHWMFAGAHAYKCWNQCFRHNMRRTAEKMRRRWEDHRVHVFDAYNEGDATKRNKRLFCRHNQTECEGTDRARLFWYADHEIVRTASIENSHCTVADWAVVDHDLYIDEPLHFIADGQRLVSSKHMGVYPD